MKALVTLFIIVLPTAAISSTQENPLVINQYTSPAHIADTGRNIDIGEPTIQESDMIPEARPLTPGEGIEYINSYLWSDLSDMLLDEGRIYCAFTYGLAILDATTSPPFETISTLYLPTTYGRGDRLEKHGDYVYFTRRTELVVIDVSDVTHPVVVGSYPSQGEFSRVLYADGALYLAETGHGLTILDVSEPANPTLLSTTTAYGDWLSYISVSGGIGVTSDGGEVSILDVSDPAAPSLFCSRALGNVGNAVVRDNLLFTFIFAYGDPDSVVIYDLSDPAHPAMMGVHLTSVPDGNSTAMMLSGSLLFTASEIVDVSDPSAPVSIADYSNSSGAPFGLDGNTLYKGWSTSLATYDVSDVGSPYLVGVQAFPGFINDVEVQGDIAYLGAIFQGLNILDISDVHHPVILSQLESPFDFDAFDVQGDILFSGRYVVDVSDPANPLILADLGRTESLDVRIEGDLAFVVDRMGGVLAFDLSDPHNPQMVSRYPAIFSHHASIAVKDTLVFISPASSPVVQILNYSDPTAPELIGTYGTTNAPSWNIAVAVEGNTMYTRIDSDLHIVDIHDPRNPVTIGIFDDFNLWYPYVMVPKGGILYTTDRYGNTIVFDVSDPTNPLYLENFETPSGSTQNLFVDGQRIYLADYYGFMIAHTLYGVPPVQQVAFDIRPGSCPNPLNIEVPKGAKANGGVLPVAVLGSDEFDVRDIDVSSLELAGAVPLRYSYKDVAAPPDGDGDCACSETAPDRYDDLELEFRRLDVVAGLGTVSGGHVPVTLTGQMKDGTPIEGTDCVWIVPRKDDRGPQLTSTSTPAVTALGPATPNPFNPTTTIAYQLAEPGHVTLTVYDVTGALIATLVDGEMPGGRHEVTWEAKGIASGMYFYRMQAGAFVQTRKMALLK